ncbi:T9SS type A sorting domain-containing protein, partial [Haliscomenobacter sp.]|uniref:T9SS type A sorting domain-containing protein n=1 Tax=Haliscomenobacter sp. TaxID=2717303 RepID=UPI003364EAAF
TVHFAPNFAVHFAPFYALSDGCFFVSKNFITIFRSEAPNGGRVQMPNGLTTRYTCPGDGKADVVRFDSLGTKGSQYRYIITDDKNNILATPGGDMADLEGAGEGICRVWGVAFNGKFLAKAGQNAATTALATGCFDLSDNFIETIRFKPNGGRVQMPNGMTTRYTCPGDGKADVVRFDSVGASRSKYAYIITDDKNMILGLPAGDMVNLEGAGEGLCRVWGVAYTGNFTGKVGDNAATAALSDECFDLSDNFIETIRFKPNGGRVQMPNGLTTRYTCPGDGKADVVRFDSVGASRSKYAYIITDDKNMILGLPAGDMVNLEGAGEGLCRVWGVAYTGNFTGKVGDNAATAALSDECFDLSDNFIETIRFKPNGGRVTTTNNLTEIITIAGDKIADTIRFASTGASRSLFRYVVTDSDNVILGLPPGNIVDFEGAGVGVCRVWGLSYTGTLALKAGDDIDLKAASDDCFAFSTNFVKVTRNAPAPLNSAPELANFGTAARVSNGKLFATPNPFREAINLNVDWSTETTEANIIVRDLTGRVINTIRTTLYNGQNTVVIDANNWPLGILTLTLYSKSEVISTKIVKVN